MTQTRSQARAGSSSMPPRPAVSKASARVKSSRIAEHFETLQDEYDKMKRAYEAAEKALAERPGGGVGCQELQKCLVETQAALQETETMLKHVTDKKTLDHKKIERLLGLYQNVTLQRNTILKENEDLHERINALQTEMDGLRTQRARIPPIQLDEQMVAKYDQDLEEILRKVDNDPHIDVATLLDDLEKLDLATLGGGM